MGKAEMKNACIVLCCLVLFGELDLGQKIEILERLEAC